MAFIGELYEAQLSPANKLCARKKMLLAWVQGSGKTIISIAAAEKLLELNYIKHVTVLCPTSIGWQWEEKIKEFTDHEDVRLVKATSKSTRQYGAHSSLYTVIPYSVFRKDYKKIPKTDLIIADEAQEFSNFRSKTFRLIKKFKSPYRWALTGTAISNKLEELYAIMEWVDPSFLPPWGMFEKKHIVRNKNTKAIIKYKNLEELNEYLLAMRVDRKTDLKGLPEELTYKQYVEKDEYVTYTESNLLSRLSDSSGIHGIGTSFDPKVSKALHEARQALCGQTKLTRCKELIRSILAESDNNRVVVFSFYKQPLYDLSNDLDTSVLFTGDEDTSEKRDATRVFRSGEAKVLLCSNAGSTGLDLPFANYVIHLDVPFSHGIMDQRSKRIRRHSSTFSSVVVIFLLVKDSIEEYYYKVTSNKKALSSAVLEGQGNLITMKPGSLKEYLETHGS